MRERFRSIPLPIQIPAGGEENFRGVIDLTNRKLLIWDDMSQGMDYTVQDIPEEFSTQADFHRGKMIETLANIDDVLAEKYLSGEEITVAEISEALRKATISLKRRIFRVSTGLHPRPARPISTFRSGC